MDGWDVVGLEHDPAPGDPQGVRTIAARLRDRAALGDTAAEQLRRVVEATGSLGMAGAYAEPFRRALAELPAQLDRVTAAHRSAADALGGFAGSLDRAKATATGALRRGQDARVVEDAAWRELTALLPPDRTALLHTARAFDITALDGMTPGLDDSVRAQVRAAVRRLQTARSELSAARRLAEQAAELRGNAERTAADAIGRALSDAQVENRSWWARAWDSVSAPFRSWHSFAQLCQTVALVAGVAALVLTGPIGLTVLAVAAVASAVVLADDISRYGHGVGPGQIALDAVALLPLGRTGALLAKSGTLVPVAGRAIGTGLTTVRSGAGRQLVGALGGVARQVAGYARGAVPALRGQVVDRGRAAVELGRKVLTRDPVDLATGDVVLQQTDLELPGLLELVLVRTYLSSYRCGRHFGAGWASTLDQRLEIDDEGVCFAAADGALLTFRLPVPGGTELTEEGEAWQLIRGTDGRYTLWDPDRRLRYDFDPDPSVRPGSAARVLPMTAVQDRGGRRIEILRDDTGLATELRHSCGHRVVLRTDADRVVAIRVLPTRPTDSSPSDSSPTDGDVTAAGPVTVASFGYDTEGRLCTVRGPGDGQPLRFEYDAQGRLTRWVDRIGAWYRYRYDRDGRCVAGRGIGHALDVSLEFDPLRRTTRETTADGATLFRFDRRYRLVEVIDAAGGRTGYERDRRGNPVSVTDPLGRITRYRYDASGFVVELVRPDGERTSISRDAVGRPLTVVLPGGAIQEWRYDGSGNIASITDPGGTCTRYRHRSGATGGSVEIDPGDGRIRTVLTDRSGQVVGEVDPSGRVTRLTRDGFGRPLLLTTPDGRSTRFCYDVAGRLVEQSDDSGATRRWRYDPEGNPVEAIDAEGRVTQLRYGPFDVPTQVIRPDGSTVSIRYDRQLRPVAVTGPGGRAWTYRYDRLGRLVAEGDPDGRTHRYGYDAAGQPIAVHNALRQSVEVSRDVLGRVVERRVRSGSGTGRHPVEVVRYRYDLAGRLLAAVNVDQPDADLTVHRDPVGRITAETWAAGTPQARTVDHGYDAQGRRRRRRTPSGAESAWRFGRDGAPVALDAGELAVRFQSDALGREQYRWFGPARLSTVWNASADTVTRTLSRAEHLGGPHGGGGPGGADPAGPDDDPVLLWRRTELLDRTGLPIGWETSGDGGWLRTTLDLDPIGRVARVLRSDRHGTDRVQESYRYDRRGAVRTTGRRRIGRMVHYQHDAAGRLVRRQLRTPSGQRLTWLYRWDALDQLIEVATPDGHRWRYLYDGVGRRVAKHRAGSRSAHDTVLFSWDGARLAEQVCPGTGEATSWDYEPGSFRPVTQRRRHRPALPAGRPGDAGPTSGFDELTWSDAELAAVVTDLLGTPTDLLAVDGARVTWTAQPAGTIWGAVDDPTGAPRPCPLGFPGQYHDDESGLVYNLHRYYDPLTASYLSVDPLGLAGGLHPHRYVDHPLATADPLGLAPYTPPSRSTPLGFTGAEDFARFGERLHAGLSEAGFPGTAALFQGSSVTGVSYRLGVPFDVGRVSDFDVALAGRPLLGRAAQVGTALRSRGTRTAPLDATALGRLGLHQLSRDLSNLAGRSVNFMIYESVNAAMERGPSILVP